MLAPEIANPGQGTVDQYKYVREQTLHLCRELSAEDMVAQSMPDASPTKWHLAHTTWFFETFILCKHKSNYTVFDEAYAHLFNSYYISAGSRYLRASRGLLTRPSLEKVMEYRRFVDENMLSLLERELENEAISELLTVGLHHEMQHQELLLTDILHLLAHNPMQVKIFPELRPKSDELSLAFKKVEGSMVRVGAPKPGEFSYDCERPSHLTYLPPYALSNRLITNSDWIEFINDKGYEEPLLWLSDGWSCKEKQQWLSPLYWEQQDDAWFQYGLDGLQVLDPNAPVCHISYYEADAFARWSGNRLPREHELEYVAQTKEIKGNFVESEYFRPLTKKQPDDIVQLYGDVWEWTQSSYSPYPHFKAEQGALSEYNGKFMANQYVLKGGSCATATAQLRPSYRNFFYPQHRWQYSGLRLARDL